MKEMLVEAFLFFTAFLYLGGVGGAFSVSDGDKVFFALIILGSSLIKDPFVSLISGQNLKIGY